MDVVLATQTRLLSEAMETFSSAMAVIPSLQMTDPPMKRHSAQSGPAHSLNPSSSRKQPQGLAVQGHRRIFACTHLSFPGCPPRGLQPPDAQRLRLDTCEPPLAPAPPILPRARYSVFSGSRESSLLLLFLKGPEEQLCLGPAGA